ncbi:MAG: PQQ-binding-like beta-propeller repeat protein [Verrucomicrobiales bacterium]|nr:PQQ-binding-like beta-propeller repeat protein [Verrucomicrobiales bacterium]
MSMKPLRWLAALVVLGAVFFGPGEAPPAVGADWPKWRGPNGDGISPEAGALLPWGPSGPRILWQTEVHAGIAGVAVGAGRVFAFGNVADEDRVQCLERTTGRALWVHGYPALIGADPYEGGPGATPIFDGRQLYTLGKWGDLFCLDAVSGAVIWSRHLGSAVGVSLPDWGLLGSPVIVSNRIYLNAGGRGLALDKRTGSNVWSNLPGKNGYSGCVAYSHAGIPAIAFLGFREALGVAQSDGDVLWAWHWRTPLDRNFVDPIPYDHGLLLSGTSLPATFIDTSNGRPETRWSNPDFQPSRSPGVVQGRYLFSFSDDTDGAGALVCIDMEDGTTQWRHDGMVPGSVIGVGGRLMVLDGRGVLFLVAASPSGYRELARAQVLPPTRTWTPPAYANGVAYVRNSSGRLAAIDLPLTPIPALGIRTIGTAVEVSWNPPSTNAFLEYSLPSFPSPQVNWQAVPRTQGTWTTNSFRTQPTSPAAWYRLRIPE